MKAFKTGGELDVHFEKKQGYPFFCGEMEIEAELDIQGENPVLDLEIKGVNAIRVEIAGVKKVMLTDNRLPLQDFGVKGKTCAKLTLINNLRNLLGPRHLKVGESYYAGPPEFFKESCVWARGIEDKWDDNFCFVEMSI